MTKYALFFLNARDLISSGFLREMMYDCMTKKNGRLHAPKKKKGWLADLLSSDCKSHK
jgi:hypothetical protein